MQDYLYSVIRFIAIAIHLIINYKVMFLPENSSGRKAGKMYRMLVAVIFQEQYPLLPFYALGCLFGNCVLHVYVAGDERDETASQLLNYKQAILSEAKIALSANAFEEDIQKSLSIGMNAHVAKPIDIHALFDTMKGLAR